MMTGFKGVFGAEYICGDSHDCGHEACRERKAKERIQERRIQDALRGPSGGPATFTIDRWCWEDDERTYRDKPSGFTYAIIKTAKHAMLTRHPALMIDHYPKYFDSAEDAVAFVDAELRKRTAP